MTDSKRSSSLPDEPGKTNRDTLGNNAVPKIVKAGLVLTAAILLLIGVLCLRERRSVTETYKHVATMKLPPTPSWTFAVSGDSRNCGDLVVPTIAANVSKHAAQFYWHLGDFRFIALVDEDMQCGPAHEHQRPAYENHEWKDMRELLAYEKREWTKVQELFAYEKHAWEDFTQYQARAFDRYNVPVFLGIGNHEMILHHDHEDFIRTFQDWLNPDTQLLETGKIDTYYHWMIGGVDFINLDNAGTALNEKDLSFSADQLKWFQDQLAWDAKTADVKTVVVGMHAALPDSISGKHSMNESKKGTASGKTAYLALWDWQAQTHKHVYVLASHSHYYMEDIFNTTEWKREGKVLQGWIVGTAGAHRNPLPGGAAGWKNAKDARTNVYGYLLGTVNPDGKSDGSIKFEFHEVKLDAVPSDVASRFHPGFVAWCFQKNTDCADSDQHCEESARANYDYPAGIAALGCR